MSDLTWFTELGCTIFRMAAEPLFQRITHRCTLNPRPLVIVCRGEAGGGDNGSHLKNGIAEALSHAVVNGADIQHNECGRNGNNAEIYPQFRVFPHFPKPPYQHVVVQGEVHPEQKHGHCHHAIQIGGVVIGQSVVLDAEAAGACNAHAVAYAVKQGHAAGEQQHNGDKCQGSVDEVQVQGGVFALGHQLAHLRPGALCLHQIQGIPRGGENGNGKHQYAHAADPVGEASPEQDPPRQSLYISQNGRTGGGEAGYAFEKSVYVVGNAAAAIKGQCSHCGKNDPHQGSNDHALPCKHVLVPGTVEHSRQRCQSHAAAYAQKDQHEEIFPIVQAHQSRHQKQC